MGLGKECSPVIYGGAANGRGTTVIVRTTSVHYRISSPTPEGMGYTEKKPPEGG